MKSLLMHPYILVFVGGGAGSLLRYATGRLIPATLLGTSFPIPILIVNVVASFVLGAVMGWVLSRAAGDDLRLLLGVGFCGGLSTFSSFSNDTVALLQSNRPVAALINISLNVTLCLLASVGGLWLGQKTA
ncbi:fluoride efflux transporter CrcB [Spirosoma sp.]|uniref:fluoride efflux transporter CrcB n=1 Tax=Spirosoma sp. TaxID=1899569 RepID=UPI002606217F|nr:fluoride efflux transporter CrcB [Spirosoma sp.]MCX6213141.1 fluoride efflux transporter CrcB [Spirosoma sp.]